MKYYILPNKKSNGAYPPLQQMSSSKLPEFPEEFLPIFYPNDKYYKGFVNIVIDKGIVVSCEWNEEAYQEYIKDHPIPKNWISEDDLVSGDEIFEYSTPESDYNSVIEDGNPMIDDQIPDYNPIPEDQISEDSVPTEDQILEESTPSEDQVPSEDNSIIDE